MCRFPDKGSTGESSGEGLSRCDKRAKAAAILTMHRRNAFRHMDDASTLRNGRRTGVAVKACRSDCTSESTGGDSTWCTFGSMQVPDLDWKSIMASAKTGHVSFMTGCNEYHLPSGVTIQVVDREEQLGGALAALRESMQDGAVAIDLEWRPDYGQGKAASRVALMQLATSYHCLLIRLCRIDAKRLCALIQFLRDPSIVLVGFSWDHSDEAKLQQTLGLGRRDFAKFIDLREVSQRLGYHGYGLATLAERILGSPSHKSRRVCMSNWEAKTLDVRQIAYAAVDALVCGHLLRSLRRWHASPCACSACQQRIGAPSGLPSGLTCTCGKLFSSFDGLQYHVAATGHAPTFARCSECGRVRTVASCSAPQVGGTDGTELPAQHWQAASSGAQLAREEGGVPQETAPCLPRQGDASEVCQQVVRGQSAAVPRAGTSPHGPHGDPRRHAGSLRPQGSSSASAQARQSVREGHNGQACRSKDRKKGVHALEQLGDGSAWPLRGPVAKRARVCTKGATRQWQRGLASSGV